MTDADRASRWWRWHDDYADPESALSRRLQTVVQRTKDAVDACSTGPITLVSACAGQGRDVVSALTDHPRRSDVRGLLVESDPANAAAALLGIDAAGLAGLSVLEGDAGCVDSYVGYLPADVVLLCGVFGNIPDDDILDTIQHSSTLCAPGATVIWTRHRRSPDLTPAIRAWWREAGFDEVAFDSPADGSFAVGVNRLASVPRPFEPGTVLFTFV